MQQYIIDQLAKESSLNGKLSILSEHKNNELFKKILYYTYNPLFNYFTTHQVREYRHFETVEEGQELPLEHIFPVLDTLIGREVTGNKAVSAIEEIANELHYLDRMVLNKIISRDLDCGIGAKSINKVMPKLIPDIPYMRCSLTDKIGRITYPAIVQQKCDGMFVNVIYKDDKIKFLTRNLTEFDLNCLKNDLIHGFNDSEFKDVVLHGELLIMTEDGDVEDRKIGNGLIGSLIKKEQTIQTLEEKIKEKKGKTQDKLVSELARKIAEYDNTDKKIQIVLWDMVSYEGWVKGEYLQKYVAPVISSPDSRFGAVGHFVAACHSEHVKLVETQVVANYEEANEFYLNQIDNGYEGAVLKNYDMVWKDHTSPEQIKLKAEKEADLIVVGYEPGTGKYEGGIGALICESIDHKLRVSVGSGFTDSERGFIRADECDSSKGLVVMDKFDCNCYDGKIISVKFNELIQSKSKDTYSLFLPRFVEVRNDKHEADDLEKIKSL